MLSTVQHCSLEIHHWRVRDWNTLCIYAWQMVIWTIGTSQHSIAALSKRLKSVSAEDMNLFEWQYDLLGERSEQAMRWIPSTQNVRVSIWSLIPVWLYAVLTAVRLYVFSSWRSPIINLHVPCYECIQILMFTNTVCCVCCSWFAQTDSASIEVHQERVQTVLSKTYMTTQ